MKGTVGILSDKLLVISVDDASVQQLNGMVKELRAILDESGYPDVHAIWFGGLELLDLRDAPPDVTAAARLIRGWFDDPQSDPEAEPHEGRASEA